MLAILALNASFSFSQLLATAVAAPPPTITAPYHQSSLEGLFGFAAQQSQPLFASADERARAIACFHRIVSCQNLALMANCGDCSVEENLWPTGSPIAKPATSANGSNCLYKLTSAALKPLSRRRRRRRRRQQAGAPAGSTTAQLSSASRSSTRAHPNRRISSSPSSHSL